MRVLIKSVDNPLAKHREGQVRDLQLFQGRAVFNYLEDDRYAITSKIKNIVIQTQNTKYECEVKEEEE